MPRAFMITHRRFVDETEALAAHPAPLTFPHSLQHYHHDSSNNNDNNNNNNSSSNSNRNSSSTNISSISGDSGKIRYVDLEVKSEEGDAKMQQQQQQQQQHQHHHHQQQQQQTSPVVSRARLSSSSSLDSPPLKKRLSSRHPPHAHLPSSSSDADSDSGCSSQNEARHELPPEVEYSWECPADFSLLFDLMTQSPHRYTSRDSLHVTSDLKTSGRRHSGELGELAMRPEVAKMARYDKRHAYQHVSQSGNMDADATSAYRYMSRGHDVRESYPGDRSGVTTGQVQSLDLSLSSSEGHRYTRPSPDHDLLMDNVGGGLLQAQRRISFELPHDHVTGLTSGHRPPSPDEQPIDYSQLSTRRNEVNHVHRGQYDVTATPTTPTTPTHHLPAARTTKSGSEGSAGFTARAKFEFILSPAMDGEGKMVVSNNLYSLPSPTYPTPPAGQSASTPTYRHNSPPGATEQSSPLSASPASPVHHSHQSKLSPHDIVTPTSSSTTTAQLERRIAYHPKLKYLLASPQYGAKMSGSRDDPHVTHSMTVTPSTTSASQSSHHHHHHHHHPHPHPFSPKQELVNLDTHPGPDDPTDHQASHTTDHTDHTDLTASNPPALSPSPPHTQHFPTKFTHLSPAPTLANSAPIHPSSAPTHPSPAPATLVFDPPYLLELTLDPHRKVSPLQTLTDQLQQTSRSAEPDDLSHPEDDQLTTVSSQNPLTAPASTTTTSLTVGQDRKSALSQLLFSSSRKPGVDPYACAECGKRYSTSSNLARHRQTHRSVCDKKARKCPHCDKVYVSMPAYSMHVRTHNQGCECPHCGKKFSRPWLLQGHIRTHTGEKPFGCPQCGKSFADKSNLRAHIQTHSTDKPYVCGRCGKAFALKSYLYKHEESSCMRGQRFRT